MRPARKFALLLLLVVFVAASASAADFAILTNGFSIRHERREVLGSVTRLYLTADGGYVDIKTDEIAHFEKDLSASPSSPDKQQNLDQVVNSISQRHHLDPDLVNSVIRAESGFNAHAVSAKGAQGLMQLMPGTALQLGVGNAFDPGSNVEGGTRYLRELLERYNFDLVKALAAYNAGPQSVAQYRGVPPYHETRAYVAKVIRDFNSKKLAERKAATAPKTAAKPKTPQSKIAKSDPNPKPSAEQAAAPNPAPQVPNP